MTRDVVTLDGRQVAAGEELMKDSATGDMKIVELNFAVRPKPRGTAA